MTLAEIRDYLKTKIDCPNWYIGKIDGNQEQCIGIYTSTSPKPNLAIGGISNTSYSKKAISILVHWGKYVNLTEIKAQEVYNTLFGQSGLVEGHRVVYFDMRTAEPIALGTDSKGIYEYVIETIIYYER